MSHTYTVADPGMKIPYIPRPSWYRAPRVRYHVLEADVGFYSATIIFDLAGNMEIRKDFETLAQISESGAWHDKSKW